MEQMHLPYHGTIIFTDELIELLKKDEEIFAVFAHELGHVVDVIRYDNCYNLPPLP